MFTNSKLAKSVKLACAFGAASSIGFTGAVNAQETEQAAEAVEKIEVRCKPSYSNVSNRH